MADITDPEDLPRGKTWQPITCGCIIVFEPSITMNGHQNLIAIFKCPVHADLSNEDAHEAALRQCQTHQQAIAAVKRAAPEIYDVEIILAASSADPLVKDVMRQLHQRGYISLTPEVIATYDADRINITIVAPELTQDQIDLVQPHVDKLHPDVAVTVQTKAKETLQIASLEPLPGKALSLLEILARG